jgi:hypothetical protein
MIRTQGSFTHPREHGTRLTEACWIMGAHTCLQIYHMRQQPSNLRVGSCIISNEACLHPLCKIGTAIYFFSPLWPYRVNVVIQLDSRPSQLVPLVDTSRPDAGLGPATVASNIVWSSTGLDNIQHTIVVSVAPGEPYAIVDGLMSAFFHQLFLSLPLTLGAGTPR